MIAAIRVEHARAIAGRLRAEAALADRPGQMQRLENEADSVDLLADELDRVRAVVEDAYRQVISMGAHVVVQPNSPRRFPIADLLDTLEQARLDVGTE